MKKKIILSIVGVVYCLVAHAQQDAMFSQYMFNMLSVNPAYAGSRDVLSATGLYRRQWLGIKGAPSTMSATLDMPIKNEKMGIGMMVINDRIGVTNTTSISGAYAYRIRVSKSGMLAFGLNATAQNFKANFDEIDYDQSNGIDPVFTSAFSAWMPNFGAGSYYTTDRFYVGLSLPHLLNNDLNKSISGVSSNARQYRHVFFMTGYVFRIGPTTMLKPSTLVKYVNGSPIEFDLNANIWLRDRIAFGASYRSADGLVGMFEFQLNEQLRFGYAYDFPLTRLSKFTSGSHELMIRYELGFDKGKILSPRYF
ncbi:MAG: type IX secretion system membrane protein PorP/SprF [Cytophagaceae bacterium]|jgi:type IX secretion system PorP/SprF family membrane protein|nr:type IX secretion system membrane protein PorP/SprF [Cytophagaceae bacterium]